MKDLAQFTIEFRRNTGMKLSEFMTNGKFDIEAFERRIKVPESISTFRYCSRKYGIAFSEKLREIT